MIWLTRSLEKNSKTISLLQSKGYEISSLNSLQVLAELNLGTPEAKDRHSLQIISLPVMGITEMIKVIPSWLLCYYDHYIISSYYAAKAMNNGLLTLQQNNKVQDQRRKFLYIVGQSTGEFVQNFIRTYDYNRVNRYSVRIYPNMHSLLDDIITQEMLTEREVLYISGKSIANEEVGSILQARGIVSHRFITYKTNCCTIELNDFRLIAISEYLKKNKNLLIMVYSAQAAACIISIINRYNLVIKNAILLCISDRVANSFMKYQEKILDIQVAASPDEKGMLSLLIRDLKKS